MTVSVFDILVALRSFPEAESLKEQLRGALEEEATRTNGKLVLVNSSADSSNDSTNLTAGDLKNLFSALQLVPQIKALRLSWFNLKPVSSALSKEIAQNTTLENIHLYKADCELPDIENLCRGLINNNTLKSFNFSSFPDRPELLTYLIAQLKNHPTISLSNIDLSVLQVLHGLRMFPTENLKQDLKERLATESRENDGTVTLRAQNPLILLEPQDIKHLFAALQEIPAVRTLRLESFNLELVAETLSQEISQNTTLENLELSNVKLALPGMETLCAGLKKNTTLESLSVSNATAHPVLLTCLIAHLKNHPSISSLNIMPLLQSLKLLVSNPDHYDLKAYVKALIEYKSSKNNGILLLEGKPWAYNPSPEFGKYTSIPDKRLESKDITALFATLKTIPEVQGLKIAFFNLEPISHVLSRELGDNTTLNSFELIPVQLGFGDIPNLADGLVRNRTLVSVSFAGLVMPESDLIYLTEKLKHHPSIIELNLSGTFTTGNNVTYTDPVTQKVTPPQPNKAVVAISHFIEGNTTLRCLNLNNNYISSEGTTLIFEKLRQNQVLQVLKLSTNYLPIFLKLGLTDLSADNLALKELHLGGALFKQETINDCVMAVDSTRYTRHILSLSNLPVTCNPSKYNEAVRCWEALNPTQKAITFSSSVSPRSSASYGYETKSAPVLQPSTPPAQSSQPPSPTVLHTSPKPSPVLKRSNQAQTQEANQIQAKQMISRLLSPKAQDNSDSPVSPISPSMPAVVTVPGAPAKLDSTQPPSPAVSLSSIPLPSPVASPSPTVLPSPLSSPLPSPLTAISPKAKPDLKVHI